MNDREIGYQGAHLIHLGQDIAQWYMFKTLTS
jgi:hypothetical protein